VPVEDELALQGRCERRENGRRARERMRKQYVKTLELLRQSAFGSTEIYLRLSEVHHQHHFFANPDHWLGKKHPLSFERYS